jgi:hypothetical protein
MSDDTSDESGGGLTPEGTDAPSQEGSTTVGQRSEPEAGQVAVPRPASGDTNGSGTGSTPSSSRYADVRAQNARLREIDPQFETTLKAYDAAFEQLQLEDKAYREYLNAETTRLKKVLGKAAQEVENLSAERDAEEERLENKLKKAGKKLEASEKEASDAASSVKDATGLLAKYKQPVAVINARHNGLKSLRAAVTEAASIGNDAVAYWLLTSGFTKALSEAPPVLTTEQLIAELIEKDDELQGAERTKKERDKSVEKRRKAQAKAKAKLEEFRAVSEADLREALKQLPLNESATREDRSHA